MLTTAFYIQSSRIIPFSKKGCVSVDLRYIGIPYKLHGRDYDGADCYGLIYLYLNNHGYTLPKYEISYTMDSAKDIIAQEYSTVLGEQHTVPENNDVVLCYRGRYPTHVGVCYNNKVLHTTEQYDSVLENLKSISQRYRKVEFYSVNKSYNTTESV